MQNTVLSLDKHQTVCFTCSPQVACFNACCRDLNQALSPYDVLCLKQFLDMSSGDFLNKYTEENTGPETGLPVVSLRFGDAEDLACPFVTDAGCRVYPARPASCRTYPLARGVSRNRDTGRLTEHWALIREPHCLGFKNGQPHTVDEWVGDQQIATHNRMNDMLLDMISLKNRWCAGPLGPTQKKSVYTALYNLDTFRKNLFAEDGTQAVAVDTLVLKQAETEDVALLLVAMAWIRETVFGISTEKTGI